MPNCEKIIAAIGFFVGSVIVAAVAATSVLFGVVACGLFAVGAKIASTKTVKDYVANKTPLKARHVAAPS